MSYYVRQYSTIISRSTVGVRFPGPPTFYSYYSVDFVLSFFKYKLILVPSTVGNFAILRIECNLLKYKATVYFTSLQITSKYETQILWRQGSGTLVHHQNKHMVSNSRKSKWATKDSQAKGDACNGWLAPNDRTIQIFLTPEMDRRM